MKILSHLRKFTSTPATQIFTSRGSFLTARLGRKNQYHNGSYFSRYVRPQSYQLFSLFSVLALGAGSVSSAYFIYRWWSNLVDEPPMKTLDDMEHSKILMESLLKKSAPKGSMKDEQITLLNKAILATIHKGNNALFEQLLQDLLKAVPALDTEYLVRMIDYAALHGKASILEICSLHQKLKDIVFTNPRSVKLLNNPALKEIEKISAAFTQGPGYIKLPEMNVQLGWAREKDIQHEKNIHNSQNYSAFGFLGNCPVEDISIMLSFMREQDTLHHALRVVNHVYDNIVVLDNSDKIGFLTYLTTLRNRAKSLSQSIESRFILCGSHFTCGAIYVAPGKEKLEVFVLHIDSLGGCEISNPHNWIIEHFLAVFRQDIVHHYVSESRVQHAPKGCSVFALSYVRDLGYFNQVLALQPQHHHFLSAESPLFAYLDAHTTVEQNAAMEWDSEGKEIPYSYRVALLPLRFNKDKQSFHASGQINLIDMTTRFAIGQMGLMKELEQTSHDRKKEYSQAVDHFYPEQSFQMYLEKNTRHDANGRPQNMGNVLMLAEWGMSIPSWLSSKSSHEIEAYKTMFSVANFQKRFSYTNTDMIQEITDTKSTENSIKPFC